MDKDTNNNKTRNIFTRKFNLWSMGYIIAGVVFYYGGMFVKTAPDEILVLIVAVVAGVLYSRTKRRIGFVKNNFIRGAIATVGLIAISAFLIGALTAIF